MPRRARARAACIDDALQPAAMDRELRHVEAGIEAARLAPDRSWPKRLAVDQLVGADGDGVEPLAAGRALRQFA